MSKIKKRKWWTFRRKTWLIFHIIFFIIILLVSLFGISSVSFIFQNGVQNYNLLLALKHINSFALFFIILINLFYFLFAIIHICFWCEKKSSKPVIDVNDKIVKEYGSAKWLHDEIYEYELETLKEYQKYYFRSKVSIYKDQNIDELPGWVIAAQYRNIKNNSLLRIEDLIADKRDKIYEKTDDIKLAEKQASAEFIKNFDFSTTQLQYFVKDKTHTIVLGSTGSGKTQKMIFPGIIRNAGLTYENKPTMIITDPKGEIFRDTSGYLEYQGYEIKVLDFRNAADSASWNPLAPAWLMRDEAINFYKRNIEVKEFSKIVIAKEFVKTQLICFSHLSSGCEKCADLFEQNCIKNLDKNYKVYIYKKSYFTSEFEYKARTDSMIKSLISNSESNIVTFTNTAIETPNGSDPYWTQGAKSYFNGLAIMMLEIMDKNPGAIPLEVFNVPNIIRMMSDTNSKKWFEQTKKDVKVSFGIDQAETVAFAPDETKGSLISTGKTSTQAYQYQILEGLLCNTQKMINLEEIVRGEKPFAVFLIVPDDDKSLHPLAAAFVDQLYKTGVKIANQNQSSNITKDPTLTRQIQFYLDEFGNFPRIDSFAQMITVARQRNMFFMIILQDYGQLDSAYGKEEAKTIKSNCNLSIYIQTNDMDTAEIFSKELGEKGIINFGATDSSGRKKHSQEEKRENQTGSISSVRLLRSDDLLMLPQPYLIAKASKLYPARIYAEFSWRIKEYQEVNKFKPTIPDSNLINFKEGYFFNLFAKTYKEWINYSPIEGKVRDNEAENLINSADIILQKYEPTIREIQPSKTLLNMYEKKSSSSYEERHSRVKENFKKKQLIKEIEELNNKSQTIEEVKNDLEILIYELNEINKEFSKYRKIPQSKFTSKQMTIVKELGNRKLNVQTKIDDKLKIVEQLK